MIASLIARIQSFWKGIGDNVDADMHAEFAHHMELRTRDLVKSGMFPEDAARQARVEFGGTYNFKQAGREARGLRWYDAFRISWLDVKLGARMIHRYPGLTVIGGFAMGVAIALGAGVMGVIALMKDPRLPLDEGERIVGIQVWSITSHNAERRIAYDFAQWKAELRSVRDLGAFRNVVRAIGAADGRAEPGRGAEMSAAGFRVARVAPLLGRYLIDDDERAGAPLVVVLGHDIWSGRFGADSAIIGKPVKIGGVPHSVVGVMPKGFAFPVNQNLWLPLRLDPRAYQPREGPVLYAFGRLAPGVTLEEAATEVSTLGERTALELPKTHGRIRPRLMPFAQSWFELDSPETVLMFRAAGAAVTLLLVIICVNIAILVYARTATRQGEIAVRSALGASRSRIVAQLLGEALVLAGIGAAVGLALISILAVQMDTILIQTGASAIIPFWMTVAVSPETVAYLVALAVLAALIIGVVPALQVTGRRVQASLKQLSGGHASVRMGTLWTSLIVAEVAFTVAILPTSVFFASESLRAALTGLGFPAERYLSAELGVNRESIDGTPAETDSAYGIRTARLRDDVIRRLVAEPEVGAVTFSGELPGSEQSGQIEVEGTPVGFEAIVSGDSKLFRYDANARRVRFADVDTNFFDAFAVAPILGRTFRPADAAPNALVVVVNRSFADSLLPGVNPVGHKLRALWTDEHGAVRGPWREIVGVVPDFPAHVDYERSTMVMYSVSRGVQSTLLAVHVRGTDPATFSSRLRAITADVDASLFLRSVLPMDEVIAQTHLPLHLVTAGLVAVALAVLILSSAGLYALMTVIVTQRRREIGIRIALGADRGRILRSIFSRAALQVCAGIALGTAIAMAVAFSTMSGEMRGLNAFVILPGVSLFMLGVGALAALGPARRGLAIQPSAVLKED